MPPQSTPLLIGLHRGGKPYLRSNPLKRGKARIMSCTIDEALRLESMVVADSKTGRRFPCPCCDHRANQKVAMIAHLHSIHTGYCAWSCPCCEFTVPDRASLARHCKTQHKCMPPSGKHPKQQKPAQSAERPMNATAGEEMTERKIDLKLKEKIKMAAIDTAELAAKRAAARAQVEHTIDIAPAPAVVVAPAPAASSSSPRHIKRSPSTFATPNISLSTSRMSAALAAARSPIQLLTPPMMTAYPAAPQLGYTSSEAAPMQGYIASAAYYPDELAVKYLSSLCGPQTSNVYADAPSQQWTNVPQTWEAAPQQQYAPTYQKQYASTHQQHCAPAYQQYWPSTEAQQWPCIGQQNWTADEQAQSYSLSPCGSSPGYGAESCQFVDDGSMLSFDIPYGPTCDPSLNISDYINVNVSEPMLWADSAAMSLSFMDPTLLPPLQFDETAPMEGLQYL
ncbi:hypothetical protein HDZ31DRAFT_61295 [Schizophyllum fasciatum]